MHSFRFLFFILFCCAGLLPAAQTAHAQWLKTGLKSLLGRETAAALERAAVKQTADAAARKALEPLFLSQAASVRLNPPNFMPPEDIRRSVFTLQAGPESDIKASAFALEIDGQIWGVTARHVTDDLGNVIYMSVPDEDFFNRRTERIFPLKKGHRFGADVALFRIPQQMLPLVRPLQPEYALPGAHATAYSAGFARGRFVWIADREVLFASGHRILTQYADFPYREGYCGSPVMLNGKVVGVHTGTVIREEQNPPEWYKQTLQKEKRPLKHFSEAVPVTWVRQMARGAGQTLRTQGETLKVFNVALGTLAAEEYVNSIQLWRGGQLVKIIPLYPFTDYEHLERFLPFTDGDQIRVVIQRDGAAGPDETYGYEWDSSSGNVTRF